MPSVVDLSQVMNKEYEYKSTVEGNDSGWEVVIVIANEVSRAVGKLHRESYAVNVNSYHTASCMHSTN